MTASSTRTARCFASARTPDGKATSSASDRTASTSDRTASFPSGDRSFSKTLSSADAFADVVLDALSFEKLEEAVALLTKANQVLLLENGMLQDKLSRDCPDLLTELAVILEEELVAPPPSKRHSTVAMQDETAVAVAAPGPSPSLSRSDDVRRSLSQHSRSRVMATASDTISGSNARLAALRARAAASTKASKQTRSMERVTRMSFNQRIDLAEEATILAEQRVQAARAEAEALAADLRARIEEAHAALAEARTARTILEATFAASGAGDRASVDKFQRYLTDWTKVVGAATGRVRLKASALRAHRRRVRADVAVKRELGEALRPVDFDKIRIEIEEYNRKMASKTRHLVDLKNISGRAASRLLGSKKRLADLHKQLDAIREETASKRSQTAALEREEAKVLEDVARADTALNAIRLRMERHTAPDLLEYVRLKQDLDLLRRDAAVWERRCKIQQQTVLHLRKAKELQISARSARAIQVQAGQPAMQQIAVDTDTSSERAEEALAFEQSGRSPLRRRRQRRARAMAAPARRRDDSRSSEPASDSCRSPSCSSSSPRSG